MITDFFDCIWCILLFFYGDFKTERLELCPKILFILVLKTTGFFEGLFEEEELISDNVKERENKIQFLNKVIYVVGATTGKTLSVKPSKIVAGQEAEKTNDLLQCLALALDKKLTSDEAVKKYKDEKKPVHANEKKSKEIVKSNKKNNDTKKITSKSTEKLTSNKRDTSIRTTNKNENDKSNSSKTKQKENTIIKNESQSKRNTQSKVVTKKPSQEKNINYGADKKLLDEQKDKPTTNDIQINNENLEKISTDNLETDINVTEEDQQNSVVNLSINEYQQKLDDLHAIDNQLNSSLSSQDLMEIEKNKIDESKTFKNEEEVEYKGIEDQKLMTIDVNKINSDNELEHKTNKNDINKQLSRNNSSEKNGDETTSIENKNNVQDPVKQSPVKNDNAARPLSMRPSSSRPGAPRLRDKHENITTEPENLIVGKVNIIAENAPIEEEEDTNVVILEQETMSSSTTQDDQDPLHVSPDQHGHLVQQILESQKEFSQISGKTEIEWQFGAQKAREAVNKEIEQLRYNVQALSRVTNPLGKILDHVQEDVEVMRQELQQWTKIYEETSKQLSKQKLLNEESLLPMHTKVKQLDFDIQEKHDKINNLKVVIHKNSIRIEKLLASGNVQ
ncbi:TRAF3-interacting protein 1 isoform X2 [Galleria mellonella]|uniref:TRAF3-interacting protein 1 isoform X2 n=1 Tax=Galleria mellonella TaxID=7137 RepID=A0ABM3MZD0_GALME|nr:TRAF3-interacting protein 1 isoform X2 [Galleria mellonella]